MTNTGPKI